MENYEPIQTLTPSSSDYNSLGELPSYVVAADNHQVALGTDVAIDFGLAGAGAIAGAQIGSTIAPGIGTVLGAVIGGVTGYTRGKFTAAAIASGTASIANTGIALYNTLPGADAEQIDVHNWLGSIDSSLSSYYDEHKDAVDITGDVAASIIPGTYGIKAYNMALKSWNAAKYGGVIGINMEKATGLLGGMQQQYLAEAALGAKATQGTYSFFNNAFMKATLAGAGEQAIQAGVFGIAATAATFKSPLLEEEDLSDIANHIGVGMLMGGGIGMVLEAAVAKGAINKVLDRKTSDLMPITHIEDVQGSGEWGKIMGYADSMERIQRVQADDLHMKYLTSEYPEADKLATKTLNRAQDNIRIELQKLTEKDPIVAQLLGDHIMQDPTMKGISGMVMGLTKTSRAMDSTAEEFAANAIRAKINADKFSSPEEMQLLDKAKVSYVSLRGEDAGQLYADKAKMLRLPDLLKKGEKIEISGNTIKVGKDNQFTFNPEAHYDVSKMLPREAEAYHLWLNSQEAISSKSTIPFYEIHKQGEVLKKIAAEGDWNKLAAYKFEDANGFERVLSSQAELESHIREANNAMVEKLKSASEFNQVVTDLFAMKEKLGLLTGIPFRIGDSIKEIQKAANGWTWKSDATSAQQISLDATFNRGRTLAEVIQTLKHEEGHNQWDLIQASNPGMTFLDQQALLKEMETVSRKMRASKWHTADLTGDYSYMRRPQEMAADTFAYSAFNPDKIGNIAPTFKRYAAGTVRPLDPNIVTALFMKASKLTNTDIALMTNTELGLIEGTAVAKNATDMSQYFAAEKAAADYGQRLEALGPKRAIKGDLTELMHSPSVLKLVHDGELLHPLHTQQVEALTWFKQRETIFKQQVDNVLDVVVPQSFKDSIIRLGDDAINAISSRGIGMGMFSFANGQYGSLESAMQWMGKVTNRMKVTVHNEISDTFAPHFHAIANDHNAFAELAAIEHRITNTWEKYIINDTGDKLVLKGHQDYMDALENGAVNAKPYISSDKDALVEIPLTNKAVADFLKEHIGMNATREQHRELIANTLNNRVQARDPRVLYFPQRNPDDYPFKAFVIDNSFDGSGHVSMLHAADATKLQALIDKVAVGTTTEVVTQTKAEAERWHKALGDFKRDEALGDNYIDNSMKRMGTGGSYLPYAGDPQILLNSLKSWHQDRAAMLIRESVGLANAKFFGELRHMDEQFTDTMTSKLGSMSLSRYAAGRVDSPYMTYAKTALDISNYQKVPAANFQNWVDHKFTQMWNGLADATAKTTNQQGLDAINQMMDKHGIKPFDYDAATLALANHQADTGALRTFVGRSQALLAVTTLGLDAMQGISSTIGSLVLMGSEMSSIRTLLAKDPEALGRIDAMTKVGVPGSTHQMQTPLKILGQAIKDVFNPDFRQFSLQHGFSSRHLDEVMLAYDNFSLPNVYTSSDLNSKLTAGYVKTMKFLESGTKIFKTQLLEETQRVMAASVMKQITDEAVKAGVMSEAVQLAQINVFVNKVQGNYLASQRPGVFHGPIGMAVGLFQTYSINLMQQLLRHVADGDAKSAAVMMGLQAGIFGANGLPGFQAINSHLVGSMPGNTEHKDAYQLLADNTPKEISDWFMYGALANMPGLLHEDLKTNAYNRGDINPRHVSILPLSPAELPIVSMSAKFFGNILDTAGSIAEGNGVAESLIRGLEHNAVNRPLAGLGVLLEAANNPAHKAYSTSQNGNILFVQDLNSPAMLSRLLGAKPLDEAKVTEQSFRNALYHSKDAATLKNIGQSLKMKVVTGEPLSEDDVTGALHQYVKAGGRQENWNKFMTSVYEAANAPQANILAKHLKGYNAQQMQRMIGGRLETLADTEE